MRTVAVVPIKGRMPLVKLTIGRLIRQGLLVVCIGSRESEKRLCEELGATFLMIPDNICLGAKWQMGIDYARTLNPFSIMIMGSSDMVQDGWISVMNEQLKKSYAMCGTESIYFLDIQQGNKKKMLYWGGYQGVRAGEPLGTGRVISAQALDLIDWQLINKSINSSIDYSICQNLEPVRDNFVKLIHNEPGLVSLSISTYQWENMHKFDKEALNPSSYLINADEIINKYFPEMFNLFKE